MLQSLTHSLIWMGYFFGIKYHWYQNPNGNDTVILNIISYNIYHIKSATKSYVFDVFRFGDIRS